MKSLWNDSEADQFAVELGRCEYTSRLLRRDRSVALHGDGNASVKIRVKNLYGEEEVIPYIKDRGWEPGDHRNGGIRTVSAEAYAPLVEARNSLDTQLVNEFQNSLTNPSAPMPSVEAILHAILPPSSLTTPLPTR